MKKIAKIISRVTLFITISIILILFGLYVWLNKRIDNVIDKETYNHLVEAIKASEDLPDRFYEIYGQVTAFDKKSTTNKYIFNGLLNMRNYHIKNPCPCVDVSYEIACSATIDWRLFGINKITIGLALDKDVSPKKCLDFYLGKFDFLYSAIGIQNASQFYYQKDLDQLSDDEMVELSVMTLNPSFYNKIRRPENLKEMVVKIKMNKERK